jgi:hypothetical protein
MRSDETPRSIQRNISIQHVGVETLVYDEVHHKAFCLNRSSSVIWRLADGVRTVDQIRDAASIDLGVEVGEELVRYALEELRRDGLIEALSTVQTGPEISRRAILRSLGVGGALLLPIVAAVIAPPAAQAYNGCVDCSATPAKRRLPASFPSR